MREAGRTAPVYAGTMSALVAMLLLPVLNQGPAVGEPFPDLRFPAVSGATTAFDRSALAGRPVLVHVFASW